MCQAAAIITVLYFVFAVPGLLIEKNNQKS